MAITAAGAETKKQLLTQGKSGFEEGKKKICCTEEWARTHLLMQFLISLNVSFFTLAFAKKAGDESPLNQASLPVLLCCAAGNAGAG